MANYSSFLTSRLVKNHLHQWPTNLGIGNDAVASSHNRLVCLHCLVGDLIFSNLVLGFSYILLRTPQNIARVVFFFVIVYKHSSRQFELQTQPGGAACVSLNIDRNYQPANADVFPYIFGWDSDSRKYACVRRLRSGGGGGGAGRGVLRNHRHFIKKIRCTLCGPIFLLEPLVWSAVLVLMRDHAQLLWRNLWRQIILRGKTSFPKHSMSFTRTLPTRESNMWNDNSKCSFLFPLFCSVLFIPVVVNLW